MSIKKLKMLLNFYSANKAWIKKYCYSSQLSNIYIYSYIYILFY